MSAIGPASSGFGGGYSSARPQAPGPGTLLGLGAYRERPGESLLSSYSGGWGGLLNWWIEIADAVRRLLEQHALPTAFVLLFLEEAGLPPIVPGDFLMMLVGMRAAEGRVPLILGTIV